MEASLAPLNLPRTTAIPLHTPWRCYGFVLFLTKEAGLVLVTPGRTDLAASNWAPAQPVIQGVRSDCQQMGLHPQRDERLVVSRVPLPVVPRCFQLCASSLGVER
jgi:hypothetical protein